MVSMVSILSKVSMMFNSFSVLLREGGGAKRRGENASSGFTMVEMVAVVLILSLLIAASSTAISGARRTAYRTHSRETARQLANAWTAYVTDQGYFPDKNKFHDKEGSVFAASPYNIGTLLNTQYLSDGTTKDPSSITYYQASEKEIDTSTSNVTGTGILDRWKNVIYFTLDFDLVGQIDSPLGDGKVNASALAFSTDSKTLRDVMGNAAKYRDRLPKSW